VSVNNTALYFIYNKYSVLSGLHVSTFIGSSSGPLGKQIQALSIFLYFNEQSLRPSHILQYIQTYVFHNHITQSVSIWDPTMHLNIDSSWICFLREPEDDLIKVETCRPDNIIFYCI